MAEILITDAVVDAVALAVTAAVEEAVAEAVAAGVADFIIGELEVSAAKTATVAVTAAVESTIAELVGIGIPEELANMITQYLIQPAMSLGEGSLQEVVNSWFTNGIYYLSNLPWLRSLVAIDPLMIRSMKEGEQPLNASKEEIERAKKDWNSLLNKAQEKVFEKERDQPINATQEEMERAKKHWNSLLNKAQEKVFEKITPGVQAYIRKGYIDALNAAKADLETWLSNEKWDIMIKSLIPLYGQWQAFDRLTNLKSDAMKHFQSEVNSNLLTFLHSKECRGKWGNSFRDEGEKFLKSDEFKKMTDDWNKQQQVH
jgi:hypothetical protein